MSIPPDQTEYSNRYHRRESLIKNLVDSILNRFQKEVKMGLELEQMEAVEARLGYMGAMLSGSKTQLPGQQIVWNSNICTLSHGKIWFGDIDLIEKGDELAELAVILGEPVYVLYEMDGRFENENDPLLEKNVAVFIP